MPIFNDNAEMAIYNGEDFQFPAPMQEGGPGDLSIQHIVEFIILQYLSDVRTLYQI